MASSETSAWFHAADALVERAFGRDSAEVAKWNKLLQELIETERLERRERPWNEGASNVRRLHESMGLLTEFELYLDAGRVVVSDIPVEITESLKRFRAKHPDPAKVAFLMMRFGKTKTHENIVAGIRTALEPFGIAAVRADDNQYHDDLFPNVLTYIHGCGFGIAVFERIESEEFNPNVALEVGYMLALKKNVCLLKDRTLKTLQADLVGKLYRVFDPADPGGTIPNELSPWLTDKLLT
jgi:hypothetical protein